MKRLIATAAILPTLGTSAFTMMSRYQLPSHVKQQITQMVPNADLNIQTTRQVAAIHGRFFNSDKLRAGYHSAGQVKVLLGWDWYAQDGGLPATRGNSQTVTGVVLPFSFLPVA